MNRILQGSLLPVVLALVSLGTVACTADSDSSDSAAVATREPSLPSAPAEALAGSAGTASAHTGVELPAGGQGALATKPESARLVVTEEGGAAAMYDVVGYDFGLDAPPSLGSGTGGAGVSKAKLRPLTVRVRPSAKSQLLAKGVFGTTKFLTAVLERTDATSKLVELARLEKAVVTRVLADAADDAVETYEIEAGVLSVTSGKAKVTFDMLTNATACADPCPCGVGTAANLGPYTQASSPSVAIPKGSTRIDHVAVELHNDVTVASAASGAGGSKPALDGITFERDLETSAVCAMYYAGRGLHVSAVKLGVASTTTAAKSAPAEIITWDACFAFVRGVGFSSSVNGPREEVKLSAAGLVRTDRAFDAYGAQLGKDATTGWSFITNTAVTSCAAVLP